MAEGTQKEIVNTASMEENSLAPAGEEVEEEEHSIENSELSVAVEEPIDTEKQIACNDDDCQYINEPEEELDNNSTENDFDGFELAEYKDPLAEDISDQDKRLSGISLIRFASRQDSGGSGISGLFQKLAVQETHSESSGDDFEEIMMGDVEVDDDAAALSAVSEETAEKIQFIINNSVFGIVKAINEDTIEQYSDFIERNYPVDGADWPSLKADMIEVAKRGPKILVKCCRGTITGYKKMDNIKIVAFVKKQNEKESKHKEIEGEVKDYNDSDVDFTLDGHLMTPSFDDCVIRVEVRKLRKKDINSRVLVGYTEIPIRDIPSTAIESYYELQKGGVEGLKKLSLPSNDALGHLVLNLSRDETEVDPNIAVPNIIKQYLVRRAEKIFQTSMTGSPSCTAECTASYQLNVTQNTNADRMPGQAAYQKLVTEDGVYPKNENKLANYTIDCVLTNRLELGVEVRRRSVSPAPNSLLTPNSNKRSSSLSPSQSMISLMTSSRRESMGSNSSLLSISNENTPKKKKSSNMLGILNKTIGSIGEDLYDIVSPTNKPTIKIIPVGKIVPSLHLNKILNHTIEDNETISWDTRMEPISDIVLNTEELKIIYENAIIESIKTCEDDPWDGSFSESLSTILNMITSFVSAKRKDINLSIAEAFVKAHTISYFCDSILKKHIETILKSEAHSENLDKYVENSLKIIESHRCDQNKLKLSSILENLKKISIQTTQVPSKITESVEAGVTHLFNSWERDLTKKIKEKTPTSTIISIQVCRDILNLHILPETQEANKTFQVLFASIIDYNQVTGVKYLYLCRDIMKKNLPENEKRIMLKYDENSPRVKALLLVYETFCAFKRIFDNLNQPHPDWLFETYKQYPDLWVELAIYKAEVQVENLLKHVRENEEKFHEIESESSQRAAGLSRDNSVDDITNQTLVSFCGITETCWKFRKELNWPSIDVNLSTGLKLIEGMAKLETRILNLFEAIHMKDEDYDALELSRTITLLDGLLRRHHSTVNEVATLHSEIANNEDMNEVDQEYFKTKMANCYEVIQKVKDKTKDEIGHKITLYCEGRRSRIKKHILEKALVAQGEDECLMKCIDNELCLMYQKMQKKYQSDVMAALWKVMEDELELQFKDRKQRNLSKNKPARFEHFKVGLPIIIDVKKDMHKNGVIADLSLDILSIMLKEVAILTEDSRHLVNKVLRMKAQAQKIDLDENGNNAPTKCTSMALKLAYVTQSDKIMVEVVNIHNITPREKKTSSRIQIYLRFSPDRMGTGQHIEHTPVFEDVGRSIIFDLQGEPVKFEFSLDHLSSKKVFEDGFLIINLFHVNKASMKLPIGECVSQVKMNGMLMTEMVQISSESEFGSADLVPSLSYQIQDFKEVYQTEVYQELYRRTSEEVKCVTSRDDKARKTSFFGRFS